MIRRMGKGDLDAVAAIWLDANREAHDFIPANRLLGHFAVLTSAKCPSSLLAGTFCRGQDCAGPGGGLGL